MVLTAVGGVLCGLLGVGIGMTLTMEIINLIVILTLCGCSRFDFEEFLDCRLECLIYPLDLQHSLLLI